MGTLRDAILAAQDLPTEEVQTDEWAPFGVPFVRVRGLSASEKEKWERTAGDEDENSKKVTAIRERLIVLTVVEEDGSPAFTDDDIKMLSGKSAAVITRIFYVARKLSGMLTTAEMAAETNPSKGDQGDADSSDSPSPTA